MGRYRALNQRERLVLELKALVLVDIPQRRFLGLANTVLHRQKQHNRDYRDYTDAEVSGVLNRLQRDGLIGSDRRVCPVLACAVAGEAVGGAGGDTLVSVCMNTFLPVGAYGRWGVRFDPGVRLHPYIALRVAVFSNDEILFETACSATDAVFDFRVSASALSLGRAFEAESLRPGVRGTGLRSRMAARAQGPDREPCPQHHAGTRLDRKRDSVPIGAVCVRRKAAGPVRTPDGAQLPHGAGVVHR